MDRCRDHTGPGPTPHLNPDLRGQQSSATLAIQERLHRLELEGKKVYRLGLGQSPFPVPACVQEELRRQAHQKDYLPVAGLGPLREVVSHHLNQQPGLHFEPQDIMIGPGSKELLFLAQLCYAGQLLLPSPSWVSYQPQAKMLGLSTRWIETSGEDGWRLDPETLARQCAQEPTRPRLLILNSPSNPTGTCLDESRLRAIARVCREARLLVISDEIYGHLQYHGEATSLARFYPEGTIVSGGLSKWCGAGGWRLGTFAFPPTLSWLRQAMLAVASETFSAVSAPIQWASVRAFQGGPEIEDYLGRSRAVLQAVGRMAHRKLTSIGLKVPLPEGGFYLFASAEDFSQRLHSQGLTDSQSLCEQILQETGVAALPGSQFGRPPSEWTFRLATVNFDGGQALAAAHESEREDSFVERYCPDLVEALDRLCAWFG